MFRHGGGFLFLTIAWKISVTWLHDEIHNKRKWKFLSTGAKSHTSDLQDALLRNLHLNDLQSHHTFRIESMQPNPPACRFPNRTYLHQGKLTFTSIKHHRKCCIHCAQSEDVLQQQCKHPIASVHRNLGMETWLVENSLTNWRERTGKQMYFSHV